MFVSSLKTYTPEHTRRKSEIKKLKRIMCYIPWTIDTTHRPTLRPPRGRAPRCRGFPNWVCWGGLWGKPGLQRRPSLPRWLPPHCPARSEAIHTHTHLHLVRPKHQSQRGINRKDRYGSNLTAPATRVSASSQVVGVSWPESSFTIGWVNRCLFRPSYANLTTHIVRILYDNDKYLQRTSIGREVQQKRCGAS